MATASGRDRGPRSLVGAVAVMAALVLSILVGCTDDRGSDGARRAEPTLDQVSADADASTNPTPEDRIDAALAAAAAVPPKDPAAPAPTPPKGVPYVPISSPADCAAVVPSPVGTEPAEGQSVASYPAVEAGLGADDAKTARLVIPLGITDFDHCPDDQAWLATMIKLGAKTGQMTLTAGPHTTYSCSQSAPVGQAPIDPAWDGEWDGIGTVFEACDVPDRYQRPEYPRSVQVRGSLDSLTVQSCLRCDFSGLTIDGADLTSGLGLYLFSDFSGATITNSSLDSVIANGARFDGAVLRDVDLRDATLDFASFGRANGGPASLDRVDLTGARLYRTRFEGTALRHVTGGQGRLGPTRMICGALQDVVLVDELGTDLHSWALSSRTNEPDVEDPSGDPIDKADCDHTFAGSLLGASLLDRSKDVALSGATVYFAPADQHRYAGADLSGARLAGTNLAGLRPDLAAVDLHGATLDGVDLSSVVFSRLEDDGTMKGANMQGASLHGTDLRGASLQAADLRATSMLEALVSGADLSGADLTGADLSDPKTGGQAAVFSDVMARDASFANVHAAHVSFAEAHVYDSSGAGPGPSFGSADLTGANFTGAVLAGTSFDGAHLGNATLDDAWCVACTFADAELASAHLRGMLAYGADFREVATWVDADLSRAQLGQDTVRWSAPLGAGEAPYEAEVPAGQLPAGDKMRNAICPDGSRATTSGCAGHLGGGPAPKARCRSASPYRCPATIDALEIGDGAAPVAVAVEPATEATVVLRSDGTLTVIIGDGPPTTVTVPRVQSGAALAARPGGGLFLADPSGHRIWLVQLQSDGTPRSAAYAGSGQEGGSGDGGGATAATFRSPSGLWVDGEGVLYVADRDDHTVRTVAPSGSRQVDGFAGQAGTPGSSPDGTAGADARFSSPQALAGDPWGTVYVADTGNHRVVAIAPDRTVRTVAGTGRPGYDDVDWSKARAATQSALDAPAGLAVAPIQGGGPLRLGPPTTLLIGDTGNHRLRPVNTLGSMLDAWAGNGAPGTGGDGGPAADAHLIAPVSVTAGAGGREVFVVDAGDADHPPTVRILQSD